MDLDDVLARLNALPEKERAELEAIAQEETKDRKFIPSPGPQTEAYFSKADVLLYGGAAGGGKSGLICGLALEEHHRSLVMRRNYTDLQGGGGLIEEMLKFNGTRAGYNGSSPPTLRIGQERIITFGAAGQVGSEQQFQGRARDFLALDEAAQFLRSQVDFLMGWLRHEDPNQRVRALLASNPPMNNTGDWLIPMFGPWLDITHPNPAKPGELRWFVTAPDGSDLEVEDERPVEIEGAVLHPQSRTFIPAKTDDNPFLRGGDYKKKLDNLPPALRAAMRDGNFMMAREDDPWQVIPTEWIRAAQARWTDDPPSHAPMSCLAADIAQGGADNTVLVPRYDFWIGMPKKFPGKDTPTGNEVAGLIVAERRNGCTIILDMGGGYGGATKMRLEDNGATGIVAYKGAEKSTRRSADQQFGFYNKRAEAHWRLREALDPSQDGGAVLALPPSPTMMSDLTAPRYEITRQGIKITPKEDVIEILGRSPDEGDAVVLANFAGPRLETHGNQWRKFNAEHNAGRKTNVTVNQSHQAARRKRR